MSKSRATTWQALADQLGINVSTLHAFKNEHGAPKESRDVADWNAFIATRSGNTVVDISPFDLPGTVSYDEAVRAGKISLRDALLREQLRGEMTKNLRLEAELAVTMRDMLTREQAKARAEAWNAAVDTRMDLVERLLDAVEGIAPEQRRTFLVRAREWRLQTKRALESVHSDV